MSKHLIFICVIILFLSLFLLSYGHVSEFLNSCTSDSECPSYPCLAGGTGRCFMFECTCLYSISNKQQPLP
ncbi:unnamed protein product [Lathyrus oleraceus]